MKMKPFAFGSYYYFLLLLADVSLSASFVATNVRSDAAGYALQNHMLVTSNVHVFCKSKKCVHRPRSLLIAPQDFRPKSFSKLSATSSASSTIAAGGTLCVSSLFGILFEKQISKTSGGHVVTLLTAALLSNISQVISRMREVPIVSIPTDHFLYDWCWSVFLPASLVFALLSSSSSSTSTTSISTSAIAPETLQSSKSNAIRTTISGLALPFVAGSIGSILGCFTAFSFVSMPYERQATALLTGCLCASYIGGTVNFFATAKLLKDLVGGDTVMGSAFGSMAAADLVVMALYFAMLTAASKSTWLHRLFPSKYEIMDDEASGSRYTSNQRKLDVESPESTSRTSSHSATTVTAIMVSCFVALASVLAATRLENIVLNSFPPPFNIPGTLCAFLAVLGLIFERLVRLGISSKKSPLKSALHVHVHVVNALSKISEITPTMSDMCFYLLFAAVGATADLASAIAGGPMALIFALLALLVHSGTVLAVTWAIMSIVKCYSAGNNARPKTNASNKFRWPRSSWEEVLTASNAAIGGPSTAAAFAARLINGKERNESTVDRSQYRSALVIGATVWGVFGYAIATGIGVMLSRFLMSWRQ